MVSYRTHELGRRDVVLLVLKQQVWEGGGTTDARDEFAFNLSLPCIAPLYFLFSHTHIPFVQNAHERISIATDNLRSL